ncbi:MAG: ChbG/HpnK family deacetylase [Deltaproteobacteria bacterium]|nr:ChbG/HpnK family deacetylase [Deltaproteobacteria bacterium]
MTFGLTRRFYAGIVILGFAVGASCSSPQRATAPVAAPVPTGGLIRFLIRGDDMAASHGINVGHIEAYRNGIMRSAEVIVPGPWLPETIKLLKENPGIDVGIHLALTSEWTNVKWRPLTWAPSIVDEDGFFFPMIWPNDNYPKSKALHEAKFDLKEIEAELRAQIELLKRHIPNFSHGGCHMGCGSAGPEVQAIIDRLLLEYGVARDVSSLKRIPIAWPRDKDARNALTGEQKAELFARAIDGLSSGDYLFVDHPATDDPEMRAIHHIGYENVAVDRSGVVSMWTSSLVKDAVARRKVQLITYRDLPLLRTQSASP